jgi:hypothetical protein
MHYIQNNVLNNISFNFTYPIICFRIPPVVGVAQVVHLTILRAQHWTNWQSLVNTVLNSRVRM